MKNCNLRPVLLREYDYLIEFKSGELFFKRVSFD